ncbi:hypothetical protein NC653_038015 [Populus alba x Populus x berolinensis]|uniref:Uncharacterized protein n=1 Tax=Populus alba x Populus x berolinensis TaxID=444605 RepID=A0AAD6LFK4_9ROSI|nr:hypothetical protein NC653_038015 [Populus alba x Populus x berolinensis]
MDLVGIVRKVLDDFARLSRLVTNLAKSQAFLLDVNDELGPSLQILLVFKLGYLSIMYLRVSLISTELKHNDCMSLVERILSRIKLWTSTSLTYVEHRTWRAAPGVVGDAVTFNAYQYLWSDFRKVGYRHIDYAQLYYNEIKVGCAFKRLFDDSVVKREELWITSAGFCDG